MWLFSYSTHRRSNTDLQTTRTRNLARHTLYTESGLVGIYMAVKGDKATTDQNLDIAGVYRGNGVDLFQDFGPYFLIRFHGHMNSIVLTDWQIFQGTHKHCKNRTNETI